MNYRLSTSRSARSRSRTLLSIDKNYARRVDTLYRKAFEAPGAIADEATRSRCRLAVMQELDGVCTVFLTHNDSSWPPTRDQLKNFQVLYPQDYISVNQANGTLAGQDLDSDASGEDVGTSPKQPKRSGRDMEAQTLALVSKKTRDVSPSLDERTLVSDNGRNSTKLTGEILSPSEGRISDATPLRHATSVDTYAVGNSRAEAKLTIDPITPRRHQVDYKRTSVSSGKSPSSTTSPYVEREASRRGRLDSAFIDPSVLCTTTPSTGTSSDSNRRSRFHIPRDCSLSPTPRRRIARTWRYEDTRGDS